MMFSSFFSSHILLLKSIKEIISYMKKTSTEILHLAYN
ncbi:hypothetical protein NT05LI_2155 [Listeria ivanovii FSL F6-596]|nr:hypothetical protein NT05LI_2155 [Listeria ivanovii FSL F6-596]